MSVFFFFNSINCVFLHMSYISQRDIQIYSFGTEINRKTRPVRNVHIIYYRTKENTSTSGSSPNVNEERTEAARPTSRDVKYSTAHRKSVQKQNYPKNQTSFIKSVSCGPATPTILNIGHHWHLQMNNNCVLLLSTMDRRGFLRPVDLSLTVQVWLVTYFQIDGIR